MNQIRDWNGKCQRCFNLSDIHIMSMFDVSLICMTCHEAETQHVDYNKARDAEIKEVKKGNRNFEGIGYPYRDIANDPVDW